MIRSIALLAVFALSLLAAPTQAGDILPIPDCQLNNCPLIQ